MIDEPLRDRPIVVLDLATEGVGQTAPRRQRVAALGLGPARTSRQSSWQYAAQAFEWNGRTYHGVHQPLISRELWRRVQDALDARNSLRPKRQRHAFAFAGLVHCGHCGCAMVGEVKKGRYVYYHCTGYKGKCPEPYTREAALEGQFADALSCLALDPDVLEWVTTALRQSHQDEKRFHDEAIARLQAEHVVLQNRLDANVSGQARRSGLGGILRPQGG